jgi:hypothetical protein
VSVEGSPTAPYHAFEDPMHDKLIGVVLNKRLELLEVALDRRGIHTRELIDDLAQDPELVASENARRDAFLARFLRVLDER